jgi:hypothetical protein
MGWINTYLSAPDCQAVMTAVQAVADKLKANADLAALHGQTIEGLPKWQGRHPQVEVMVALSTLLGIDEQPGELAGYDREKYRPPQDLIDHVTARDRICRGPHCHRHARRCEIDHVED